ncbi:MAG: sigma-70 family RNA polymerase sigma factor [Planctomycetes bacterium]|nr:sigma-70 family RNA polymerase sigma factor [Planctomycetota bacterium]
MNLIHQIYTWNLPSFNYNVVYINLPSKNAEILLHTTSLTLLQKLRIQDPDGWESYTKLYLPLLYKWLKNVGISDEDAQDICQEVFINTYTSLSSFEHHGTGSFRRWLRTIVNRRISDHFRKKEKDSPVVPIKGSGPKVLSESWEEAFVNEVYQSALAMVRQKTSPRDWAIFEKLHFSDNSIQEIAKQYKITANSAAVIRCRILFKLREIVGDCVK